MKVESVVTLPALGPEAVVEIETINVYHYSLRRLGHVGSSAS